MNDRLNSDEGPQHAIADCATATCQELCASLVRALSDLRSGLETLNSATEQADVEGALQEVRSARHDCARIASHLRQATLAHDCGDKRQCRDLEIQVLLMTTDGYFFPEHSEVVPSVRTV